MSSNTTSQSKLGESLKYSLKGREVLTCFMVTTSNTEQWSHVLGGSIAFQAVYCKIARELKMKENNIESNLLNYIRSKLIVPSYTKLRTIQTVLTVNLYIASLITKTEQ